MGRAEPIVMMNRSFSSRGQTIAQDLMRSTCMVGRRRDLDGDAAEFAVALPAMAIAEKEIGSFHLHREIGDRAWGDVGQVHVAPPIVRLQRQHRFDLRAEAQRADEGLERQNDLFVEAHAALGHVIFHHQPPTRPMRSIPP
jgi:hypothetical protein